MTTTLVAVEVTAADIYAAAYAALGELPGRRLEAVTLSTLLALVAGRRLGAPPELGEQAVAELLAWLRHHHMCDGQTSLDTWGATASPAAVRAVLSHAGRHYAGGGAMTTTTLPASALGPDVLEAAADRLVGLVGRARVTLAGLRAGFGELVRAAWPDLTGVEVAGRVDELVDAIGEHLLALGQHPHRTLARTVADWLLGASRGELATELQRAASWWRAALTPGRLR